MKKFLLKIITFSVCMSMLTLNPDGIALRVMAEQDLEPRYSSISARGVWHRPNSSGKETTLEGLCSVLDEMSEAGINIVFLETFYHGMTIFKTNLVPYYTGFEKYDFGEYPDYLTAFTLEAKKRGIEVHAWVECFYLGINEDTPLVKYFPDWLLINESGRIRHTTEGAELGGYIFFDPANENARKYLLKFYDEMLSKVPEISGLNLDYIRYPVSDFYSGTDTGYTDASMSSFVEKYDLSVNESNRIQDFKAQIRSNSLVEEWTDYRAQQVTSFVGEIHEMVSQKHRDCIISVAVHPDISNAYQQKKQDFITWIDKGYIDVVTPMVYYYDAGQISSALRNMLAKFEGVYCYSGLYTTYHDQSADELERHIDASDSCGADGFVLFESLKTFFKATNDYAEYLTDKYGNGENISALPHWSTDRLIRATSDIIVEKLFENGVGEIAIKEFADEMERISQIGEENLKKLDETIDEIAKLRDNKLSEIVGESLDLVIKKDFDLLLDYLEIRKTRLSFKGYDDIAEQPEDDENPPDIDSGDQSGASGDSSNIDKGEQSGNGDNSVDQHPNDNSNKKSFFDLIRIMLERVINWLKGLFN